MQCVLDDGDCAGGVLDTSVTLLSLSILSSACMLYERHHLSACQVSVFRVGCKIALFTSYCWLRLDR